jgi:hypothetical protein
MRSDGMRLCGPACYGRLLESIAQTLPAEAVESHTLAVHGGLCPTCGGAGPVDLHASYATWSAVVVTRRERHATLSCRGCAAKRQFRHLMSTSLMGWWAFPWGPIFTVADLVQNLRELARSPDPAAPSAGMQGYVRRMLAEQWLRERDRCEGADADELSNAEPGRH